MWMSGLAMAFWFTRRHFPWIVKCGLSTVEGFAGQRWKKTGIQVFDFSAHASSSSSFNKSAFDTASRRFFFKRSGLYFSNSLRRVSYSVRMSFASAGTKNNTGLRSMWRKNRRPRPCPPPRLR